MVARERFELSSAGPKPAMLVHYSRRKAVLSSTGLLRATQTEHAAAGDFLIGFGGMFFLN
jgi:hypothetical protein